MLPTFNGAMSAFMNIYLEIVNMILNLLHNLLVGNWRGISNLSYCYSHMPSLKEGDLEAFQYLHNGGFTGSISGRPHLMIPVNQIIEMTRNESCKETDGLSGKHNMYSKYSIVYWEIYFTRGYNQRKASLRSNKKAGSEFFLKKAIRKKSLLILKMKVNHLRILYLYLITKSLIYLKSWNGPLQANRSPSATKETRGSNQKSSF